jgi:hypothetical protein
MNIKHASLALALALASASAHADGNLLASAPSVLSAETASARRVRPVRTDPYTSLGRTFVNEGGWWSIADQYLVWTVYMRRLELIAPGHVLAGEIERRIVWIGRLYSTKSHPLAEVTYVAERRKTRSVRQQWTNGLTKGCSKPKLWPKFKRDGVTRHPPWRKFQERCERVMARGAAFLRGEFQATCTADKSVDHWGGPMDDERAVRAKWVKVDFRCVEDGIEYIPTNHAWCDPAVSDCKTERKYAYAE